MTRVYLIRHCEAEGNIYRRAQGHFNGQPTSKGWRQIAALAEKYKDTHFDALYSSDLDRTRATATAITKYHDLTINLEPRLREINMGVWEGQAWGNLQNDYPEQMIYFNDDPERWHAEGGETFLEVRERMLRIISELAARHDGQTIACVTHGVAIRAVLSKILGVASNEISQKLPYSDNTGVSLLEVDGDEMKVVFYNDNSHLEGELSTFARQTWWKKPGNKDKKNLRFEPLDPNKESELYNHAYSETWRAVYGSLKGYEEKVYLEAARRHFNADNRSIVKAYMDGEIVGVTEIDIQRGEKENYGWISLCFVEEASRRNLLGVQLLGHAVCLFRAMGRDSIRLTVAECNEGAIAFYNEYGFEIIGESDGVGGKLFIMEKTL